MKNILFIPAFLLISCTVSAQANLKLGYFGESITHYGLKAGYEKPFSQNGRWLYAGALAVFRHPHNSVGIILSPELEWRRMSSKGRFIEATFAPSLFHYFYEGKTFRVNKEGELEKIPLAGRTAFLPTISFGFGKDLSVKRSLPLMWYSRVSVMRQFPYNASSLTRVAIELGIIKKLK